MPLVAVLHRGILAEYLKMLEFSFLNLKPLIESTSKQTRSLKVVEKLLYCKDLLQ